MTPERVLIVGAAGRDFHTFNVYFRDNPAYEVVAFFCDMLCTLNSTLIPPLGFPAGKPPRN